MTEAATTDLGDAAAGDKAGKMISAENANAIMSAMKALMELLGKAGIDTAGMKSIQLEVAQKCGDDDMPMVMLPPAPFGGATSFAQAVQFMAAQKQAGAVEDLTSIFRQLQDNILGNDDLGSEEKASAITALSNEYAARLQDPVDNDPYYNGNKSGMKSLLGRARSWFGRAAKSSTSEPVDEGRVSIKGFEDVELAATDADRGGAFVFQDKAGVWRWLGIWSNTARDREGERFPVTAHKDFIDWSDRTGHLPQLWGWHTPGSRMGQAEMVDHHGTFTVAAGKFDPGFEDVAARLAGTKDLGMSHGYVYKPSEKVNGEIKRYRTFELTVLPRQRAANEGTAFVADKEGSMNATKEAWLRSVYGDERVNAMKSQIDAFEKALPDGDNAIGLKEVLDALADPEGTAPAPATKGDPADKAAAAAAAPATDQAPAPAPPDTAIGAKALADMLAAAVKEATQPLEATLEGLKGAPAQLAELRGLIDQHGEQLAALKEADDAKIAAAFAPRAKPATAFKSATDSPSNVVDPKDGAALAAAQGDETPTPVSDYVKMIARPAVAAGA